MKSIDELETDVDRTFEEYRRAKEALRLAREAAAEFHVGDVVEARRGHNRWEPAIVRKVDVGFMTYYHVAWRKKDGDWYAVDTWVGASVRAAQ